MLYQLDLGFRGLALAILFFCPVFCLVIRQRWRIAKARQEEVMRLVMLASEESARVEMESALAYVSSESAVADAGGPIGGGPQCVVCYSPTTTRCSRCKAVRYCSGRCQIIHWRQGHKEECHPPPVDDHCNGQVSVSNFKEVQAERSELSDTSLDIEGKAYAKPVETFSKRSTSSESNCSSEIFSEDGNPENKPFVNSSGTESSSDSSSCSTFSGPVETSDDASASEDLLRTGAEQFSGVSPDSLGESLSSDSSPDIAGTAAKIKEADLTKFPPPEVFISSFSVNSTSCSINSKQKVSTCKIGVECSSSHPFGVISSGSVNCTNIELSENNSECQDKSLDSTAVQTSGIDNSTDSQTCEEGDCIQLDARPTFQMSVKLSNQVKPFLPSSRNENSLCEAAASEGAVQFETRDTTTLGIGKSGCIASGRRNDTCLMKSKEFRSLSSASPSDHLSSSVGGCSVLSGKSFKVDTAPKEFRSLSSASPPDHLSSSVGSRSVLSDKSSKVDIAPRVSTRLFESTGSVSNGASDLKTSVRRRVSQQPKASKFSRNNSPVMLFPYDLFIKLYNLDKVELRPCGFTNCGNSCYANAVLQCLAFTRPLTAYLLEGLHSKTCPKKEWCFTCEFESLLMKTKQGKSPLSPIEIISHIQNIGNNLGHGKEEDAHEFLRYAIDAMQSACLKEAGANAIGPFVEETTLINLIFCGYLRSKIQCMRCQGKSERHERMMDLTVEIHGDIGTLEEALARFTATEVLDGENKYQCNRCKSYERAKKKLTISEAPNVLTIALKRYQSGKFGKLNKTVRFPEYLNLAPYMSGTDDKSPVYRLYGVVVHLDIMNAAFSGHYVCYVKNTQGKWYKIDDSVVKPAELDRVLTKGAYMLLYARCSPHAPSLLRKAMSQDHRNIKKSKCREDSKARSNPTLFQSGSSVEHSRGQDYIHNGTANFEPNYLLDERFHRTRSDSSSDSSSLFSCSDEGSCSTESTRDSTSTEEYSEYIFGESGHISWNSPLRFSEDSDGFTYSPLNSRHSTKAV